MSRSQSAMAAIRRELERRASYLDGNDGLVTLTVTVKFVAGSSHVRGVVVQDERVEARQEQPSSTAREVVVISTAAV